MRVRFRRRRRRKCGVEDVSINEMEGERGK
jgi:hypothetical protein